MTAEQPQPAEAAPPAGDTSANATPPAGAPVGDAPPRRRPWLRGLVVLSVLLLAALAVYALPHWRNPRDSLRTEIANEGFSDDSWRTRWSGSDDWTVQNGRLVSRAPDSARLTLRRRISVPVAIEYTAQIQPGQRPGDLSVVWSESGTSGGGTGQRTVAGARTFSIQAGGYDNSYCGIFLQPGDQRLAYNTFQLEVGRDYRFRVEIEGSRIAMLIDGITVLEHRDRFPSTSGFISLLGWYPGKSFDNVVVMGRPVQSALPPSATGDALYAFGHYDDAATMYGRLAEGSELDSHVVQDAIFRKGIAERRAKRLEDGNETWSRLSDPGLAQAADALRLEDLLRTRQNDLFIERARAYWIRSALAHPELRQQWSAAASAVANSRTVDAVFAEALLRLRQELFADDPTTGYEAARVLHRLERYEDVLRDFPRERRACVGALFALGRLDEVERLPYLVFMDRIQLAFSRGDYNAVVEMSQQDSYQRAFAMCKMGRAGELRGRFALHPAMLHLGQADEMLKVKPVVGPNEALLALGRIEEAAGEPLPDLPGSGREPTALAMLGRIDEAEAATGEPLPWLRLISACEAGDREAIAAARAALTPARSPLRPWFPAMVIGPFVDHLQGRPEPFEKAMHTMADGWKQYHGQRAWLFARAMLGQAGEADVTGMPAVLEGQAWWLVASGLRAEREGHPAQAKQAYDAFLALPSRLRLLMDNNLSAPVECLVRWRSRALAK